VRDPVAALAGVIVVPHRFSAVCARTEYLGARCVVLHLEVERAELVPEVWQDLL
jgi:hypothetical protein